MHRIKIIVFIILAATFSYAQDARFSFVQISDTHLGDSSNDNRLEKVVESINSLPMEIECVVHTGDLANNNIENEKALARGLAALKKLKVPVHLVPGNHDIVKSRAQNNAEEFKNKFGGLSSRAEYKGVVFLFMFNEPLRQSYDLAGYEPVKWMENELKLSGGKPVILFHHSPSVDDFYENRMHDGWGRKNPGWEKLLNSYNVKAVIAGHFHRDEAHWIGDVPLYVAPPVAGYWGRQAAYRIYEYDNGKLGYRTQYVEAGDRD